MSYGFSQYKRNLRQAFKDVFTYVQWKRLAREHEFAIDATATQLTFEQWVGLYRGWTEILSRKSR